MSNISLKNNNIELNAILETVNSLSSGKEEQEKSIEITENGTTEITPDEGKTLSKVSITTNIEGVGSDVNFLDIKSSLCSYSDNNLTDVYSYAFATCASLSSVNLPTCTRLNDGAFFMCTSLTSVDLPKCNYIGASVFTNCTSLTSVDLPVCTLINGYAFQNCRSLISVNLPVCSSIGYYAFYNCISLLEIYLPSLVAINNTSPFAGCTALSLVNLPVCSNIGATNVFSKCTSLTSLVLGYSGVVKLNNINAFNSTPMSKSTYTGSFGSIYVPASLVDAYKSATNWVTYADRITAIVE